MSDKTAALLEKLLEGQTELFKGQQQMRHEIHQLSQKLDAATQELRCEVGELKQENEQLKQELCSLKRRVDMQEQYSRSKNVIFYDVPGVMNESRVETEAKIAAIMKALECNNKVVTAHRLGSKANTPIVAVFESKPHAQEVINAVKKSALTLKDIGIGGQPGVNLSTKVTARAHLSPALSQLLKAAAVFKVEANWGWTKVIISRMEVEIYEGRGHDGKILPPVTVSSIEDILKLRAQLVEQGKLPEATPSFYTPGNARKKRPRTSVTPNGSGVARERSRRRYGCPNSSTASASPTARVHQRQEEDQDRI